MTGNRVREGRWHTAGGPGPGVEPGSAAEPRHVGRVPPTELSGPPPSNSQHFLLLLLLRLYVVVSRTQQNLFQAHPRCFPISWYAAWYENYIFYGDFNSDSLLQRFIIIKFQVGFTVTANWWTLIPLTISLSCESLSKPHLGRVLVSILKSTKFSNQRYWQPFC